MVIEKRPSGSYRVRMMVDGKRISIPFDHEPTEKEILLAFSKKVSNPIKKPHITFEVAANEYCKLRENIISPKTLREYKLMPGRLSKHFCDLYLDEIGKLDIQAEISSLCETRKPKTVKNYYDYIMAVIRSYIDGFNVDVTVPEVMVEKLYLPTDKELHLLFESARNHKSGMFFIPIVLGSYGLRRSEICALTVDDFEGDVVHIKRAKVENDKNEWIIKEYPKNSTSIRDLPIDHSIVELIRKQGYVYNGHPNSISDYIAKFCKRNNVRHFSLHKLRHYFCSRLISENVDVKTTITMSGHSTDSVMKRLYLHSVDSKVQEASAKLDSILFGSAPICPNTDEE